MRRRSGFFMVLFCAMGLAHAPAPANAGPAGASAPATPPAPHDVRAAVERAPRRTWQTHDGLIGEGPGYKVRFADGAFTYVPNAGDRLDDAWTYRFLTATAGGRSVVDAPSRVHPRATGEGTTVVEFARGAISERYSLRADGVEQVFLIHTPLGQGDVVLTGAISGKGWQAAEGRATGGVTFGRAEGVEVRYGAVTVIDADQRAISAPVTIEGSRLHITVDGAWLATARYPVAVDPIITRPVVMQGNEEKSARRPSIAYDSRRNRYFVVFDRAEGLAASPRDIIGVVLNAAGTQRQSEVAVSAGVDIDEFEPAAAYQAVSDEFLVAYVRDFGIDTDVNARRLPAGTFANTFDLIQVEAQIGTSGRHPFVSATTGSGANRWLVGFEDNRDADVDTDWTLYGRLVTSSGALDDDMFLSGSAREADLNGDAAFNPRTGQFLVVFDSKDAGDADRIIRGVLVNGTTGGLSPLATLITDAGVAQGPTVIYNLPMDQFWVAWTRPPSAFGITIFTGAGAEFAGDLELPGNVIDADLTAGTSAQVVALVSLVLDLPDPSDNDYDIAGLNFQYGTPSGSFQVNPGNTGAAPDEDDRASRTAYNPYYGSYLSVRDHWSVPEVEHDIQGALIAGPFYPILSAGGRFDADAITDRTVVRINPLSEQMTWFVNRSTGGVVTMDWGTAGDVPAAGNYAGDARTDFAVWRPSTGTWFIRPSDGSPVVAVNWGGGQFGDLPVPADYNGDGRTDVAVFRPGASAVWYGSSAGGGPSFTTAWGTWGDIPVPGDYNGDGVDDVAVWRPSNGVWYIRYSGGGFTAIPFGSPADQPVVGDFDGDGADDLAVVRTTDPGSATWFVRQSSGGSTTTVWGVIGDLAIPGDFNGDGRTDLTVWRPGTNSTFYSKFYGAAGGLTLNWGTMFDLPVSK